MYQSVYIVVYFNKVTIMFKRRNGEMVTFVLSCSEVLELWLINRNGNSCVLGECKEAKSGSKSPRKVGNWKPPQRPLKSGENVSGTLQV